MSMVRSLRSRARLAPLLLVALLACEDDDEVVDRQIDGSVTLDAAAADGNK